MSIIAFKYKSSNTQTAEISTGSFPQPNNINGLGAIFTGYVNNTSSYTPLYDTYDVKIGYATFSDSLSNLGYNGKTYVTEYGTYFLNESSISYSYSWESLDNSDNFPVNSTIVTRIIASTGIYYNKEGQIAIGIENDGTRVIIITINV